jgi:hypothetical protein
LETVEPAYNAWAWLIGLPWQALFFLPEIEILLAIHLVYPGQLESVAVKLSLTTSYLIVTAPYSVLAARLPYIAVYLPLLGQGFV